MHSFKPLTLLVSALFFLTHVLGSEASDLRAMNSLEARYARAHSLGNNYHFSARDGWQTVNVTNLQYKYRRDFVDEADEGDGVNPMDDLDGSDGLSEFDGGADEFSGLTKRAKKKATFNPPSKSKGQKKVVAAKADKKDSSKPSVKASGKSSKKAPAKPKAAQKTADKPKTSAKSITSSVKSILASLKGTGKAEPVTITW